MQPGQGVAHAEPVPYYFGDPRQGPALTRLPAEGGGAGLQHLLQPIQLKRAELASDTTGTLRGQRLPATGREHLPPAIGRGPRHSEPLCDLPVTGSRFDEVGRSQPHALSPGLLFRAESAPWHLPVTAPPSERVSGIRPGPFPSRPLLHRRPPSG